jgi:ATP-dependent Clp protease protease subunit
MIKKPIRVIEGTAKPHERFWKVKNEEGGEPEIEFYGIISEYSWFGDEITPRLFKNDLYAIGKGGPVTVHIDSPGGEVYAASTIRAIMMDYPADITIKIDGICLSAATIVATAGDKVLMQESGYMMIHEPWLVVLGNSAELKEAAKFLDVISAGVADCYETRTKLERSKIVKMMADETYMNARKAKDLGFIDEIITGRSVASNMAGVGALNCLKNYLHVPVELLNYLHVPAELLPMPGAPEEPDEAQVPLAPEPSQKPDEDDGKQAREAQNLRDYLDVFGKGATK